MWVYSVIKAVKVEKCPTETLRVPVELCTLSDVNKYFIERHEDKGRTEMRITL
jgi:hypothetical protein